VTVITHQDSVSNEEEQVLISGGGAGLPFAILLKPVDGINAMKPGRIYLSR